MPSMTDSEIVLDYSHAKTCEFCGAALPMLTIPTKFATMGYVPIGYTICDCNESQAKAEQVREENRKAEAEKQAAKQEEALERAGIPPRYRNATHVKAEKVAEMVMNGRGFYIHGQNGTLKTTLAAAAGIILVNLGKSVMFVSTYDLMDAMRSRKDEDRTLFDRAASCDVLILDDLGKEASNTAYACERLFAIIDKRDKAMLPTIITSNYKLSAIAKNITEGAVGTAIASRLADTCKQVHMEGPDRRLTNG